MKSSQAGTRRKQLSCEKNTSKNGVIKQFFLDYTRHALTNYLFMLEWFIGSEFPTSSLKNKRKEFCKDSAAPVASVNDFSFHSHFLA